MKFNRITAPLTSDFVLAMRNEFGDDQVQITAVHEGPVSIGTSWKRPVEGDGNLTEGESA